MDYPPSQYSILAWRIIHGEFLHSCVRVINLWLRGCVCESRSDNFIMFVKFIPLKVIWYEEWSGVISIFMYWIAFKKRATPTGYQQHLRNLVKIHEPLKGYVDWSCKRSGVLFQHAVNIDNRTVGLKLSNNLAHWMKSTSINLLWVHGPALLLAMCFVLILYGLCSVYIL